MFNCWKPKKKTRSPETKGYGAAEGIEYDSEEITKLRIEYVKHLPIDESLPPVKQKKQVQPPTGTEGQSDVKLVGGDTLLFAPDVTDENKQAVLDCILLAQLAANKKFPQGSSDNTMDWYNAYGDVLLHLGWPSMSFQFEQVKMDSSSVSINTQLLKILADLVSTGFFPELGAMKLLDNVKGMIDSLEKDSSGDYSKIYSSFHSQSRKNAFSTGVVTQNPDPNPELCVPILSIFAFDMNVETSSLTGLCVKYQSQSADLKSAKDQVILNKKIFKSLQSIVEGKLGDRLKQYVIDIDI